MKTIVLSLLTLALACVPAPDPTPTEDATFVGAHKETLRFGEQDNSEVIKLLPSGERAVLVASKSRKVTLLGVNDAGLEELRSLSLFPNDPSESELTHIDFDSAGEFAVITRTQPIVENEVLVACAGSLVFVDVSDSEAFGTVLREIEVGPMPDAVDVSDDDRWVVSADEVDFNDGKCPLESALASVSVIELPGGDPIEARLRARIEMVHDEGALKREPEQLIFASDNDRVAVTLQDTHELLTFSVTEILGDASADEIVELTSDALRITSLPNRTDGAEPWPDGVHRFTDAAGDDFFAVAGEFNDTVHFFTAGGDFVSQLELTTASLAGDLPRGEQPAALRPDSVASFRFGGGAYLALSLKHVGAVAVLSVDEVAAASVVQVIKVGANDEGGPDAESTLGTEGISAHDSGRIVTANEDESSASLVSAL